MDQLGVLNFAWIQGYTGQTLHYIDNDVLCHQCGKHIKFFTEDSTLPTFFFPGNGVGPFAVHKMWTKFAITERCCQPKIFVYDFPSCEELVVFEDGATIEFQKVEFSHNNYLLSLSGVPDFMLVVWDFEKKQKLASVAIAHDPCTSVAFNPLNWRQICVTTKTTLTMLLVEQNYDNFMLHRQNTELPPEQPTLSSSEDEEGEKSGEIAIKSSFASVTRFKVVPSYSDILGIGETAERLDQLEDKVVRISPVAQAWTPAGEIFISSEKGHLLKINYENCRPEIVYWPRKGPVRTTFVDQPDLLSPEDRDRGKVFCSGWLGCLVLHQLGLFAVGGGGNVVQFNISGKTVDVIRIYQMPSPLTTITFSYDHLKIALGSSKGSIFVAEIGNISQRKKLTDIHFGEFVAIGVLTFPTSSVCVTARDNGMIQAWNLENGKLLASTPLKESVSSLTCSPSIPLTVVGGEQGNVYFLDFSSVQFPRLVQKIYLYHGPCKNLVFEEDGLYLFTGGCDGNVFVLSGRPSFSFKPLGYVAMMGEVRKIATVNENFNVKVAVDCCQTEYKSLASSSLVCFDITSKLIRDREQSYKNTKCEFMDKAINRIKFNLHVYFQDVALGLHGQIFIVACLHGVICTFKRPAHVPPEKEEMSLDTHNTIMGNQLPGGMVIMSPYSRWLVSYGRDGMVVIHSVKKMDHTVKIELFSQYGKGVTHAILTRDCRNIIAIGEDGMLCCCQWKWSKAESFAQLESLSTKRAQRIEQMWINEDKTLSGMDVCDPSLPDTRSAFLTERAINEHIRQLNEAMEKEELFSSPPPTPKPNSTWLQRKEFEAFVEEKTQFAATKKNIREGLQTIRKELLHMMSINDELPDREKLEKSDFHLNIDELGKEAADEEIKLENIRQDIQSQNQKKALLAELIKKECWDNMSVKGRSIKAFNSDRMVPNFPLIARGISTLHRLEVARKQRQMEVREFKIREQETNESQTTSSFGDDDDEKVEPKYRLSDDAMLKACGGDSDLFYSQFDLHLRDQKIKQIILVEESIHKIKKTFNTTFDQLHHRKMQEVDRIKARNRRIAQIFKSLERSESSVDLEFSLEEEPEQLFEVHDHELKTKAYVTEEEQKKLDEEQRIRDERMLASKKDNMRERALNTMMGGVLEIRREDILKQDIPVPWFVNEKDRDEWTEDEEEVYEDYKAKVKELKQERETFRKQLESELRGLQNGITSSMAAFDETHNDLIARKMSVQTLIFREELKILRLRLSLLTENELLAWGKQLKTKLEQLLDQKMDSDNTIEDCNRLLDNVRGEYEVMLAEDRLMEKRFKREFLDIQNSTIVDNLQRHFRKRPRLVRPKAQADTAILPDGKNPNPFREHLNKQMDNLLTFSSDAINELDKTQHMPEGCNPAWWQTMCELRRIKIDHEVKTKEKAQAISEMQNFLQRRMAEDEALKKEIERTVRQISKVRRHYERFTLNVEVQLVLKQGQVEVNPGAFVRSYEDCLLINPSIVGKLNAKIRKLGEEKFKHMEASLEFSRGIIQLEWEHKKQMMEMEDLKEKLKDIQMMKITREVQAFLKEESYEVKKAKQIAVLEQTIATQNQHHKKCMAENQKIMKKIIRTMHQRATEQTQKHTDLTELNVTCNERHHIDDVFVHGMQDTSTNLRIQQLKQRRQLVDLAKFQAQEIAALKAEILRLQLRSFPTFVHQQDRL